MSLGNQLIVWSDHRSEARLSPRRHHWFGASKSQTQLLVHLYSQFRLKKKRRTIERN